jgi:hypothetical protein
VYLNGVSNGCRIPSEKSRSALKIFHFSRRCEGIVVHFKAASMVSSVAEQTKGESPMNYPTAPPEALTSGATESPALSVQSVARLAASALSGLHRVNGQFLQVSAAVGDDGYIDVNVTGVDFTADNVTIRVLLYPTAAEPVAPRSKSGPRSVA